MREYYKENVDELLSRWSDIITNISIQEILIEAFYLKRKKSKKDITLENLILTDLILSHPHIFENTIIFENLSNFSDEDLINFGFDDIDAIKKVIMAISRTKIIPSKNILKEIGYSDPEYYNLLYILLINLVTIQEE